MFDISVELLLDDLLPFLQSGSSVLAICIIGCVRIFDLVLSDENSAKYLKQPAQRVTDGGKFIVQERCG